MADDSSVEETKQTVIQRFRAWGENSFPPTLLASMIAAQHMRPFQFFPMIFPPVLIFSSYANLQGFKTDTAGISAAFSGLPPTTAVHEEVWCWGVVRGATLGLALVNMVGGGLAYTLGKREEEEDAS
ncbi:hypothetical protein N7453_006251 [Penicillium expansum]|nr:hypothetical protein N7453_006251 [Penicillium expansum]